MVTCLAHLNEDNLFQKNLNRQISVLYNSIQSDNVNGVSLMIHEWYIHYCTKYDEVEATIELERMVFEMFKIAANFASTKCLDYFQTHYPRCQDELNEALLFVCHLGMNRKLDDIAYFSTTELYKKRTGERKKEKQYSLIQWLLSLGADLYTEYPLTDEDQPIEQRKQFATVTQTLLWYHNTELLNRLCKDGLEIRNEDLVFLSTMLDSQENFPFIEENFLCISMYITSLQAYHLMLEMASRGEYFLMKTFYGYIGESRKRPEMYVEMFRRCPSYITRQWITETLEIDHDTLNGWIRESEGKQSESKKRKINFLYEIYQKEAKWQ
jgi:hypothetical protein